MKKVFYAFHQDDHAHLQELEEHLSPLRNQNLIETWRDDQLEAGTNIMAARQEARENADIFLFLVSSSLLNDTTFFPEDLSFAQKRMNLGECQILPVLLSDCLWEDTIFGELAPLPDNRMPILNGHWKDRLHEALTNVAKGVLKLLKAEMPLDQQRYQKEQEHVEKLLAKEVLLNEKRSQPDVQTQEKLEDDDFERIRKYGPNLHEILRASTYDSHHNMSGLLSDAVFKRWLFALTPEIILLRKQLFDLIDGNFTQEERLLFLTGFPGNGKTTFIRQFIAEYEDRLDFRLFDMNSVRIEHATRSNTERNKQTERAVLGVLIKIMAQENDLLIQTFHDLIEHRDTLLRDDFITLKCSKALAQMGRKGQVMDLMHIVEFMYELDYKDSFTCFFAFLFHTVNGHKRHVIIFDNLDVINVEHLGNHFMSYFAEALWNADELAQSAMFLHRNIGFSRNFKFVFCLREANFEYINAHVASRLDIKRELPLKFSLDTMHFKEIVEKRLRLFQELYSHSDDDILKFFKIKRWFDALLTDDYFNRVFVPLYNRDFRKSVATLISVVTAPLPNEIEDSGKFDRSFLRGMLFFYMIREMRVNNFMHSYNLNAIYTTNGTPKPYCNIERMLLTVVLNYSSIGCFEEIDNARPVSMYRIMEELKKAYSDEEIFGCIAKCFLYHRNDWAHLITIVDKDVFNEKDFIKEMRVIAREKPDDLRRIKVRLNPAGFIYLRYILPHFEFYNMLSGGDASLFQYHPNKVLDEGRDRQLVFEFEPCLERVFKTVQVHVQAMTSFYKMKYMPNMTTDDYRTSSFAFKHFGGGSASIKGYFQSTRTITSHIGYLDNYRMFLLNKSDSEIPKVTNRVEINKAMCRHIKAYILLLSTTIDDRAHKDFLAGFMSKMQIIENTDFTDFTTRMQVREL